MSAATTHHAHPAPGTRARWVPGWRLTRLLLAGGAAATVFYIGMDAAAALRYDGYSYRDQTISELSAVDAPTRQLWLFLTVFYEALIFAFALGVLAAAGSNKWLRITGWLLMAYAVTGFIWPFAPMHRREVLAAGGGTMSDTMHLVLAGITVPLSMLIIGFGAAAFGRRFRRASAATIVFLITFGILIAVLTPGLDKNEDTPWLGIVERANVFGFMTWFSVFAVMLIRRGPEEITPPARAR